MGVPPAVLWSWGEDQVELLLASAEVDAEYGQYGELLSEAMSEDANPNNYESGIRYVADGPHINYAAKAVGDAQDAFYKEHDISRHGHVWGVKRVEMLLTEAPLPQPDHE